MCLTYSTFLFPSCPWNNNFKRKTSKKHKHIPRRRAHYTCNQTLKLCRATQRSRNLGRLFSWITRVIAKSPTCISLVLSHILLSTRIAWTKSSFIGHRRRDTDCFLVLKIRCPKMPNEAFFLSCIRYWSPVKVVELVARKRALQTTSSHNLIRKLSPR